MWNVSSSVLLQLSAPPRVALQRRRRPACYQEESHRQKAAEELRAPSRLRAWGGARRVWARRAAAWTEPVAACLNAAVGCLPQLGCVQHEKRGGGHSGSPSNFRCSSFRHENVGSCVTNTAEFSLSALIVIRVLIASLASSLKCDSFPKL